MTTRGPGGVIPNQGNPPAAKGVGRNAKRHDLETPATPGLSDSDLQVGDVGALEQGQRISPIKHQAPATGERPRAGTVRQPQPSEDPTDIMSIIEGRLGGSISTQKDAPLRPVDQDLKRRGAAWVNFLSMLSRQPGASPLLRAATASQLKQQILANSFQTQGGALALEDVDNALEGALNARPN